MKITKSWFYTLVFLCVSVLLQAQPYIEVNACSVEEQMSTAKTSVSSPLHSEGSVLVDLDYQTYRVQIGKEVVTGKILDEYSIVSSEYDGHTLYYWILDNKTIISGLVHDNSFTPKWMRYLNTENGVKFQYLFQNCDTF